VFEYKPPLMAVPSPRMSYTVAFKGLKLNFLNLWPPQSPSQVKPSGWNP